VEVVDGLLEALEAQWVLGASASPADLSRPSRVPAWSIFDVMNHSIGITLKFALFASGATDRPHSPTGDLIDGRLQAALQATLATAREAWSSVDMNRTCQLPFGTFPARLAAGINLVDVLAHGWDVGPLGGEAFRCPDEVWDLGLVMARTTIGPERDLRHFAPEVEVPVTCPPQVRFLAFLGRSALIADR
jgi:uncharacterized protein (TIGR03086 family)